MALLYVLVFLILNLITLFLFLLLLIVYASCSYLFMNVTSFPQSNTYFLDIVLLTKGMDVITPSVNIHILFATSHFFKNVPNYAVLPNSDILFLQPSSPPFASAPQLTSIFTTTILSVIPTSMSESSILKLIAI